MQRTCKVTPTLRLVMRDGRVMWQERRDGSWKFEAFPHISFSQVDAQPDIKPLPVEFRDLIITDASAYLLSPTAMPRLRKFIDSYIPWVRKFESEIREFYLDSAGEIFGSGFNSNVHIDLVLAHLATKAFLLDLGNLGEVFNDGFYEESFSRRYYALTAPTVKQGLIDVLGSANAPLAKTFKFRFSHQYSIAQTLALMSLCQGMQADHIQLMLSRGDFDEITFPMRIKSQFLARHQKLPSWWTDAPDTRKMVWFKDPELLFECLDLSCGNAIPNDVINYHRASIEQIHEQIIEWVYRDIVIDKGNVLDDPGIIEVGSDSGVFKVTRPETLIRLGAVMNICIGGAPYIRKLEDQTSSFFFGADGKSMFAAEVTTKSNKLVEIRGFNNVNVSHETENRVKQLISII